MTEWQDLFLDKLVGAPVGADWQTGPFRVLAELVPGKPIKFWGSFNDSTAKSAIAGRVGYPVALLEAAQGAVSMFPEEADRRAFAMTLIRTVAPEPKPKRRPAGAARVAALAVTRRAHGLVCSDEACGVSATLDRALALDTEAKRHRALGAFFRKRCPMYGRHLEEKIRLTAKSPALERTIFAAQYCSGLFSGNDSREAVHLAVRESARAAALARGVEEAVSLCAELARRIGMEVS